MKTKRRKAEKAPKPIAGQSYVNRNYLLRVTSVSPRYIIAERSLVAKPKHESDYVHIWWPWEEWKEKMKGAKLVKR